MAAFDSRAERAVPLALALALALPLPLPLATLSCRRLPRFLARVLSQGARRRCSPRRAPQTSSRAWHVSLRKYRGSLSAIFMIRTFFARRAAR